MLSSLSSKQGCALTQRVQFSAARPVGRVFAPAIVCKAETRKARTTERHRRLRRKLVGTTERPRLAVFKSNNHIYAQVIDDSVGHTLASVSTLNAEVKSAVDGATATIEAATEVGKKIAALCSAKNISAVAFDRGGNLYHGRVQAVADGAREGGLEF